MGETSHSRVDSNACNNELETCDDEANNGVDFKLFRGEQQSSVHLNNIGAFSIDGGGGGGGNSDGMMDSGDDSDSSEEIHYGPGFVSRLKSRYMSVALRSNIGRCSLGSLRRTASLEDFIETTIQQDARVPKKENRLHQNPANEPKNVQNLLSPAKTLPPKVFLNKKSMKRAESVEVLSILGDISKQKTERKTEKESPPPPLPPKNVGLLLNSNLALVNDRVIVEDKVLQPPPLRTESKKPKEGPSQVPPLPYKKSSTPGCVVVAKDTVKETRKLFEGNGAKREKSLTTNKGVSNTPGSPRKNLHGASVGENLQKVALSTGTNLGLHSSQSTKKNAQKKASGEFIASKSSTRDDYFLKRSATSSVQKRPSIPMKPSFLGNHTNALSRKKETHKVTKKEEQGPKNSSKDKIVRKSLKTGNNISQATNSEVDNSKTKNCNGQSSGFLSTSSHKPSSLQEPPAINNPWSNRVKSEDLKNTTSTAHSDSSKEIIELDRYTNWQEKPKETKSDKQVGDHSQKEAPSPKNEEFPINTSNRAKLHRSNETRQNEINKDQTGFSSSVGRNLLPSGKIREKYFDSNIEAESSPPSKRLGGTIGNTETAAHVAGTGHKNYKESWTARQDKENTLLFNFTNSQKDVSHIENDGLDLTQRIAASGAKNLLISDMNPDQEVLDAENIIFVGANIMTGKSSIRYATKSKKMHIRWKDETEVFEYPSPEVFNQSNDESNQAAQTSTVLKSNTSMEMKGGLGSYTPSKIQLTESLFQLGISKRPVSTTQSFGDPKHETPENRLDAVDNAVSWGSSASSDMLF